jgi:hypothetical protein
MMGRLSHAAAGIIAADAVISRVAALAEISTSQLSRPPAMTTRRLPGPVQLASMAQVTGSLMVAADRYRAQLRSGGSVA